MNTQNPILSCAGRPSASIDAELLKELLKSFTPNYIGVKAKAYQLSAAFDVIANGEYGVNTLDEFKSIIYREFLQLQLTEAAILARNADVSADLPSVEQL